MLNKIKVKSKECSLCGSKDTESYAVWIEKEYKIKVDCNNKDCISNKINNG